MGRDRSHRRAVTSISWGIALLLAGGGAPLAAKEVLKLATLAPQGSVWDTTLREMGARWTRETEGRVELRVYPSGVAGDETDVVRKIRIGQFQGAALTVTGLAEIEPSFRVFHIPMLIESWDELTAVLARLRPELERRLSEKGFVLLAWGHGGWVHLFSRQPIRALDDLKRQKMFVWAGDDEQVQQWRRSGYLPVPLAATDVAMGFQTKMIDVVPTTPIAALNLQWFRQTPYMMGLGLAPLVGAVVVKRESWEKIAPADRALLAAAGQAAEERFVSEIPKQDSAAVVEMKSRGLTVIEVPTELVSSWKRAAEEFAREARESIVPADILDSTRQELARLRATVEGGN